jgi:hypothetical protein
MLLTTVDVTSGPKVSRKLLEPAQILLSVAELQTLLQLLVLQLGGIIGAPPTLTKWLAP